MTQNSISQIQQSKLGQISPDTVKTELVVPRRKIDPASFEIMRESISRDSAIANDNPELKESPQTAPLKKTVAQDSSTSALKDTLQLIKPINSTDTFIQDSIIYAGDPAVAEKDTLVITMPDKFIRKAGNIRKEINQDQWIWGVIIAALILFASTRLIFNKYLATVFSGLFNYTASSHLYRERGYSLVQGAFRLDLLFLLTITTFLYQLFSFIEIQVAGFQGYKLFLILFGFISTFTIIKFLINRFIAIIAMNNTVLPEIIFNKHLFYKALGVILLPLIIILELDSPYLEKFFMLSSLISITFYIISLARSLFIGFKKGVSIYYLILYLCTLEILPLLMIYKLFMEQI
jgi:hypothetical protein